MSAALVKGRDVKVGDRLDGIPMFFVLRFEDYTGPLWPGRIAYDREGRGVTVFDDYSMRVEVAAA